MGKMHGMVGWGKNNGIWVWMGQMYFTVSPSTVNFMSTIVLVNTAPKCSCQREENTHSYEFTKFAFIHLSLSLSQH